MPRKNVKSKNKKNPHTIKLGKKKSQEYIAKKSNKLLTRKRKRDSFVIVCKYSFSLFFFFILNWGDRFWWVKEKIIELTNFYPLFLFSFFLKKLNTPKIKHW